jgi:hypothetical protein
MSIGIIYIFYTNIFQNRINQFFDEASRATIQCIFFVASFCYLPFFRSFVPKLHFSSSHL